MQGMGGGLTRIQVELYESEGLSYELCRSERNPADNNKKKKNRLLKQSCATHAGSTKSKKGRQTKLIYKLAIQCFYFYLMLVLSDLEHPI